MDDKINSDVSHSIINSCMTKTGLHGNAWLPCSPLWVMQLFCHPSILYGALTLFTVGSGEK